jgi:prepilin-type N-terminal cleavage/methylation domain-containing protein
MTRPTCIGQRGSPGYTAVEVLMAMTVMAIGAAAVMSMQKASVTGNLDARKTDVANSIARTWVERLERDAMQWTAPGPTAGSTSNIAVAALIANGVANAGTWVFPNQYIGSNPPFSPGFDILGRDLAAADLGNAIFCANVRLSWLSTNALIRADVRVLWPRGITGAPASNWCKAVLPDAPDPHMYHSIYVTTALRGNPQ